MCQQAQTKTPLLPKAPQGFSLVELLIVIAVIGLLAAIAVPNFVRQKAPANEASAISSVRTLTTAQTSYASSFGGGQYGSLANLQSSGLIDGVVGSGSKADYTFTVTPTGNTNFTIIAVPVVPGTTGTRGFYADATFVIRYTMDGSAPNASSPPLVGS